MLRFLTKRLRGLSRGGIAGLALILAAIGVGAFIMGARWESTSPTRCASCHQEMTALWEQSTGHPASSKVTCHNCHSTHTELGASFSELPAFLRDKLFPEKYMASSERINARCLGCHEGVPAADKEQKKLIRINHKAHLAKPIVQNGKELRLGCVDCHASIAHDKAMVETNRPPMYGCFVAECHAKERNQDRCQLCHYQMLENTAQKPSPTL